MERKLYQHIASLVDARLRCIETNNSEWRDKHEDELERLVKEKLPSGSGFDSGTTLDLDASKPNKLVFITSYHHMDENGMYDGWTEHKVIVTPDLASGFDLRITGRNWNDIKDYMGEVFNNDLSQEFPRVIPAMFG